MFARERECPLNILQCLLPRLQHIFDLQVLHGDENVTKRGTWFISHSDKVIAVNQRGKWCRLHFQFPELFLAKSKAFQVSMTAEAVHPMHFQMVLKVRESQKTCQRALSHLFHVHEAKMVLYEGDNLRRVII